jgi:hypothetical protein
MLDEHGNCPSSGFRRENWGTWTFESVKIQTYAVSVRMLRLHLASMSIA